MKMDPRPDFPVNFSDPPKHQRGDGTVGHTIQDEASEGEHLLTEPKSDNIPIDGVSCFSKENPGKGFGVDEVSRGFEFGLATNYGGLHSDYTLGGEGDLKLEILDGFLDEVDEVDDIYAAQDLSTTCEDFLLDIELTDEVSELNSGLHKVPNSSSESHSPMLSGNSDVGAAGLSVSSMETVQEAEYRHKSLEEVICDANITLPNNCVYQTSAENSFGPLSNDSQNLDELDDGDKPIASFILRAKKGEKENPIQATELGTHFNQKSSHKATRRLETTSQAIYDFRPRRGRTMDVQSDPELTASEFEDDHPRAKISKSKGDRRKNQRMWTLAEVTKLVDGISQFGVGKWTDIKRLLFPSAAYRTPIDLRDKWRNLLKASSAHKERLKHDHKEVEEKLGPAVRPLPKHIVHRIRELAAMHPYPNSKFSRSGHGGSSSSLLPAGAPFRRTSQRKNRG